MTTPTLRQPKQHASSVALVALVALACLALYGGGARAEENCFEMAGKRYGRDPWLYYAIAQTESSMRVGVVNDSHYERTKSVGLGLMQIDSRHLSWLSKRGITRESLLTQPCQNVMVGAEILEDLIRRHGENWNAVGANNAGCTQLKGAACEEARLTYVRKVWKAYQQKYTKMAAKGIPVFAGTQSKAASPRPKLRVSREMLAALDDQGHPIDAGTGGQ